MWDQVTDLTMERKKELACEQTHSLAEEMDIKVPDPLVEAAVQSSFYMLRKVSGELEKPFMTLSREFGGI